jgi:hypothetical protein
LFKFYEKQVEKDDLTFYGSFTHKEPDKKHHDLLMVDPKNVKIYPTEARTEFDSFGSKQ